MPATTLSDRAIVRLSGEDVRGFLNGLVTQDVTGDLPVWAGLLTPQGNSFADGQASPPSVQVKLPVRAGQVT